MNISIRADSISQIIKISIWYYSMKYRKFKRNRSNSTKKRNFPQKRRATIRGRNFQKNRANPRNKRHSTNYDRTKPIEPFTISITTKEIINCPPKGYRIKNAGTRFRGWSRKKIFSTRCEPVYAVSETANREIEIKYRKQTNSVKCVHGADLKNIYTCRGENAKNVETRIRFASTICRTREKKRVSNLYGCSGIKTHSDA